MSAAETESATSNAGSFIGLPVERHTRNPRGAID
jgi:hypothetical protein